MRVRLRVKEVARGKGMSQGKLSRRADVGIDTVRRIFQNPNTANVTIETLARLASALQVDVRELLESVPDDGEEPGQEQ